MHASPVYFQPRPASLAVDAPAERWPLAAIEALFDLPFAELLFRAQTVHRAHFDPTEVQLSTLLSVKTGGCPENCAYCPQAAEFDTGVEASKLLEPAVVLDAARRAQAAGANSIFYGDKLLTSGNPDVGADVEAATERVRTSTMALSWWTRSWNPCGG